MSNYDGYELNWDGQIEKDSPDFILLPEGDYDFEVVNFERARHNGSEKLPACNKAIVHLQIDAPEGTVVIKHNLFLHSSTEGLLCAFFTCIGQRKKGERINMNWSNVIGAKGRAKVGIRKWTGNDGREFSSNEIRRFLEPPEANQQHQQIQQQTIQPQVNGYQPGRF